VRARTRRPSSVGFGTKTITPKKVQVTLRFNEEVLWADEDYQLGVLQTVGNAAGTALSRALDLGVYHAINPLTGTAISGLSENLTDTTNSVEIGTAPTPTPRSRPRPAWSSPTATSPTASRWTRSTPGPRHRPLRGRPQEVPGPGLRHEHHQLRGPVRVGVLDRLGHPRGHRHQGPRHHRRLLHDPLGRAAQRADPPDRVRRPRRPGRPASARTSSRCAPRSSTAGRSWTCSPSPS
jgi:hypothetical protein